MNENELERQELTKICITAHTLTEEGRYDDCRAMLAAAMARNPDAPEPHNLLGLLLERCGDHATAMKHFRAAWALDPSYRPARDNLDKFGGLSADSVPAWQRDDCGRKEAPEEYTREWRVGRFIRRILCA